LYEYYGWDSMGRGKENEVTVQITNTGQFLITIPKAIAFGLELDKGMKMEWMIRKEGLLLRHSKGDR
jgi:bifunctional DNA-binding transcriptional regulator/antitoxin component of YhaV-PrlF toxin-antitoxin module